MSPFNKAHRRSFSDQKKEHAKIRRGFYLFFTFLFVYLFLVNFIFSMRVLENSSMNPGFSKGDRFIFVSFGKNKLTPGLPFFDELPLKRGNIVLVDFTENRSAAGRVLSSLTRFFTLGRFSIVRERVFIKRVIALPGDEVSITNFVARVRPADGPYTYTEYESASKIYYNNIPENDVLWDESVPFSGNMAPVLLKEGEYFLLADDRSNTNDSRTWGPVPAANIAGKALLRFWPFASFGVP
ncbi:MAG: signal peptidase I [Spirochaetaceae bacterium]|jgi:signal peptidase I|nr:signal peptidase I [Spirochaetaceae bacterium]